MLKLADYVWRRHARGAGSEGFIKQALFFARSESLDRDYLIRPYSLQKLVGDAVRANARVQEAYLGSAVADAQAGGH